MTFRFGRLGTLSGLAAWALLMAFLGLLASFSINDGHVRPVSATAAGILVFIAGYDTVIRRRYGGQWPTGRGHTIAAAVITGTLTVVLSTVVFLTFPGA